LHLNLRDQLRHSVHDIVAREQRRLIKSETPRPSRAPYMIAAEINATASG